MKLDIKGCISTVEKKLTLLISLIILKVETIKQLGVFNGLLPSLPRVYDE